MAEFQALPWIHQTDLFRPPADPDDHWDLACVYALAAAKRADLRGVVIDYPPEHARRFTPDVQAVNQLGYHFGVAAPTVIGSSLPMETFADTQADAPVHERNAVDFMLDTLRESPRPVVIHLAGSCRDIALAANRAPELFAEKCAGIYVNAGMARPHPTYVEYNVRINPAAFAALFRAGCPINWMPCFGSDARKENRPVEEFGTWYDFRQGDVFPHLPARMQNYFAYALGEVESPHWLAFLGKGDAEAILQTQANARRNMWCTAGFFHAAGLTVTTAGEIVPLEASRGDAVFEFVPAEISVTADGLPSWQRGTDRSKDRIFRVRDLAAYPGAMTTAMRTLLSGAK